jgi:8-oxo-dGTP pyrophosphatase MutT (NUDIX family)
MKKDYCPGYLDLAAGGVVGFEEDEDQNAKRELEEELSIVEPNP